MYVKYKDKNKKPYLNTVKNLILHRYNYKIEQKEMVWNNGRI